ncbi:hypothetical protein D3C75_1219130 [compost metagenome]
MVGGRDEFIRVQVSLTEAGQRNLHLRIEADAVRAVGCATADEYITVAKRGNQRLMRVHRN